MKRSDLNRNKTTKNKERKKDMMYTNLHPNHKMYMHSAEVNHQLRGSEHRHMLRESRQAEAKLKATAKVKTSRPWSLKSLATNLTAAMVD